MAGIRGVSAGAAPAATAGAAIGIGSAGGKGFGGAGVLDAGGGIVGGPGWYATSGLCGAAATT
jgi:hypothetical protein